MKKVENCPICNSVKYSDFLKVKDFMLSNEVFNIVSCESCGFHFTNPIPFENEIGKYYKSDEYISHSSSKKNLISKIYHLVRTITLKRKVNLVETLSKGKKILDYGAGTGNFLNACKDNEFEIHGIEKDLDAQLKAKENFGLELRNPDDLFSLPNSFFDCVTMWHVLEHVYDLDKFVSDINRVLKTDGVFIIAVPNFKSYDANFYKEFWAAYDVPRHIYHFQKSDLQNLAKKHSFQLVKILPMKWDSYYVSMLSEKYKKGNIFNAILTGFISNLKAKKSGEYSSLIYILKKN